MDKKNILLTLTKNFFVGFMIIVGGISALLGATAFESLTSNPSDSGNQSLSSPILSKIGGVFNRDTMSLEAIADGMVNWKECETKTDFVIGGPTSKTLSCTAGYTIVDSFCSSDSASGRNYGHCSLSGNNTMYIFQDRSASTTNIDARKTWGSIKCCKYLVP